MTKFCDLTGQVAVVTGASSGIGRASSLALARRGARVTLAARRIERLNEVAREIKAGGGEALAVKTDVLKKAEIENMVEKTVERWGRVDILLNNAGIAVFKPFLEMTEKEWDQTLDVNLKGYFLCAQAAAREMAKRKYGRIINIASVASGQVGVGFPLVAHYCASKGGIVALTEALATELAPMGITVNAIAPGLIETEMTAGIMKDEKGLQTFLQRIPLRRVGRAEEIADTVVFLASKENSYMSGAMVVVDGGWLAG